MLLNHYKIFNGHKAMIFALCVPSKQNKLFLSGSADGWLVAWDLESGDGRVIFRLDEPILSIVEDLYEPDWFWIGTLEGNLHKVNKKTGEFRKIKLIKGGILSIIVRDERIFISGDEGLIISLDKASLHILGSVQISHKRCRALLLQDKCLIGGTHEGSLVQLDIASLDILHYNKTTIDKPILHLCQYQDSIFASTLDGKIVQFHSDLSHIRSIAAHASAVYDIRLVSDDHLLASASRDKSIRLWDPDEATLVKTIDRFYHEGHYRSVNALSWIKSEKMLISCSDDSTIRSWQII